ncbi:MAG: hypothetical protein IJT04_09820 [Bacteroidales bacterium]|nr:hypothetical protein [Bacteroidales bacterium]
MKKKKIIIIICISVLMILVACLVWWRFSANKGEESENQRKELVEKGAVKREVEKISDTLAIPIHRYDQDIFNIDLTNVAGSLKKLSAQYPSIFIDPNAWKDAEYIAQIKAFVKDPVMQELHRDVDKMYPDLDFLQKELEQAFSYYRYYFPEATIPQFYTAVAGVDVRSVPILWVDDIVIIGLDWYLGADSKHYDDFGLEKYRRIHCDKRYIAMDCFSQAIGYWQLPSKTPITLLDNMIEVGKVIYFTEMMFPKATASDIMGYTTEQFAWAEQYQADVWNYLIENELLFSKEEGVVRRLVDYAPFSNPFVGSPGRIGAYIGWKIVINYMEKNPNVTLQELMLETDSRKILDKSGYKPLK